MGKNELQSSICMWCNRSIELLGETFVQNEVYQKMTQEKKEEKKQQSKTTIGPSLHSESKYVSLSAKKKITQTTGKLIGN